MNIQILEKLKQEFVFVGDEKISGHTAMKIIQDVVDEFTIPKEIEEAQKYVSSCESDLGFMGSPAYYEKKQLIEAHFAVSNQKKQGEAEKATYEKLKIKFEGL